MELGNTLRNSKPIRNPIGNPVGNPVGNLFGKNRSFQFDSFGCFTSKLIGNLIGNPFRSCMRNLIRDHIGIFWDPLSSEPSTPIRNPVKSLTRKPIRSHCKPCRKPAEFEWELVSGTYWVLLGALLGMLFRPPNSTWEHYRKRRKPSVLRDSRSSTAISLLLANVL